MTGNVRVERDDEPLNMNHNYDSAIVAPPILAPDFNFLYLYEFLVNRGFFGGLPHEDPNLHIKNFLLVCALHRQKNVSDDALRLRLFPFSLKGKARTWLDDLPVRSIHNWDELLEAFLDEFFPRGVIVELRCRVSTFKQKPNERLHEAWMRYKKCLRMCPQHRCTDESLLQRFYFTLNPENQFLADTVAKGAILNLTFTEQSGSSKDKPIGKNFQEKRMQLHAFLNFDGASKGNPGLAGAGAVLGAADGSVVYPLHEGLGFATNNVAEYRGVILGLKYALEKGFKHIQVQGDSELVCMQTQGIWKTKNQNMMELSKTVKELKDQFVFPYQPCRKRTQHRS